jgi:antirestriction protein
MSDDVKELPVEIDESQRDAWQCWLENGMEEDADQFLDSYMGEWSTVAEYAEEFVHDNYDVPEWCQYYIDYELMARDWDLSGDIWTANSETYTIHIFRG